MSRIMPPRHAALAVLVALAAFARVGTAQAQSDPRVDWSAMAAFWPVHDTLAAGRDPGPAAWDALFTSEGFAAMLGRERRRETYAEAFRAAFMPGRAGELAALAARSGWHAHHVPLLAAIPAARDRISGFAADGAALAAALDSARTLAAAWLPAGTTERHPMARVSWAPIAGNRGYPGHLILDPSLFLDDPRAVEMLGHELHHHYRARIATPLRPLGDDLAAWALVNVENEGSAGQVDKRPLVRVPAAMVRATYHRDDPIRAYYRDYPAVYAASPRWLRHADSLLGRLAAERDSASRAALARALHGGLPDQGRAMGSWMFDQIERAEGRAAAVAVVGDPFGFWSAYQRVALASGGAIPALSTPAMRVVDSIAARYRPDASGAAGACGSDAHRAFDFWVGTWDVIGANGAAAGRNVITRLHGGCTLHEAYVGGGGYAGQSLNAYDATRDRWHQTWSDVTGLLLRLEGGSPRPGVMRMAGPRTDGQGREVTDRITWTANPDGTVRQHWESSLDGGATWSTTFDGRYVRVPGGP